MNFLTTYNNYRLDMGLKILLHDQLGHNIYLLDETWKGKINYDFAVSKNQRGLQWLLHEDGINTISHQEVMETDKIDAVLITAVEHQEDIIKEIYTEKFDTVKYIVYWGNDITWYQSGMLYFDWFKNHIAINEPSYLDAKRNGCNAVMSRIPTDNRIFKPFHIQKELTVNSYIHYYKKYWKNSYNIFKKMSEEFPNIKFVSNGFEEDKVLISPLDVAEAMNSSLATAHIKEKEGYGHTVIESMSCGIPVIAPRALIRGKIMENWVTNDTAIIFDNINDFRDRFNKYLLGDNVAMSKKAIEVINREINVEEQASKMKKFLEELI